jgi:hypothetical protein
MNVREFVRRINAKRDSSHAHCATSYGLLFL